MHQRESLDPNWDEEDIEWYLSFFNGNLRCSACPKYFSKGEEYRSKINLIYCSKECYTRFLRRMRLLEEGQGLEITLQESLKLSNR